MPFFLLLQMFKIKKTTAAVGFFEYGIEIDLKLSFFYAAIMSMSATAVLLDFSRLL